MNKYDPKQIELKWQRIWEDFDYANAKDFENKPKLYHLVEFPYPSGEGLHVGHCMGYGASDAYCRMKRMQGYNVLFPIGWDAFGLPTENYAIKNKIKPQEATKNNVDNFRRQMKQLGYSFDFSREVNTTDPNYYKWTQWIFLQFYKHGIVGNKLDKIADDDKTTPRLAYQAEMPVNWCPSCKINLANEEVIAGKCERCGTLVEKRMQKQWMLRITSYADRLIKDLDDVDYEERIKTQQIKWIGRSEGANIKFKIDNTNAEIEVFTTRADTLFGCTYVVLSPEHPLIDKIKESITNKKEVENYISDAKNKSDLQRTELDKEKTGVELKGILSINPINNEKIPVWIADYVLPNYGTGAVMAVPAHDQRDFEFAKKYHLSIKQVVMPELGKKHDDEEKRNTITAIVRRKNDDKLLAIKWKEFNWLSLPIGGIDNNEDPFKAAEREVFEETGYKVRATEFIGGLIEMHFYAENKKVWRDRIDQPVLCYLINETKYPISKEESNRHESKWVSAENLLNQITHKENAISIKRLLDNNYANIDYGILINSGEFDGLESEVAKKKITEKLIAIGSGDFSTNFKLRDWIFSRQHYWGEPIPIIHCPKCGPVPVPEDQLPVILPEVDNYEPTDTGKSPLDAISEWVNVKCPRCDGSAKRETDTMPNWAGSSWYYLRYCDPLNDKELASKDHLKYWTPVDIYNGGMEHTTLHLLYSRFWHKFLYDLGVVPTLEPYQKRIAHGIILGADNQKMSKSKGNVINPDDIVMQFGADTLRAYIMFIGPYEQESAWSVAGVHGVFRFLNRLWKTQDKVSQNADSNSLLIKLNQTISGVTQDLENFKLNTVVSKLMELNNALEKEKSISRDSYQKYLKILYPIVPHVANELWQLLNFNGQIEKSSWPKAEAKYLESAVIKIAVQVNGKTRLIIDVDISSGQNQIEEIAKKHENIKKTLANKKVIKTIYIPRRILNFVIE